MPHTSTSFESTLLTESLPKLTDFTEVIKSLAQDQPDYSHSPYDIAIVSLVQGPQQMSCIQWLKNNQLKNGIFGAASQFSWYENYVCTYAASIAFRNVGLLLEAE